MGDTAFKEMHYLRSVNAGTTEQWHADGKKRSAGPDIIRHQRRRQNLLSAWEKLVTRILGSWSWKVYAVLSLLLLIITSCTIVYSYGWPFGLRGNEARDEVSNLPAAKPIQHMDLDESTSIPSRRRRPGLLVQSSQMAEPEGLPAYKAKLVEPNDLDEVRSRQRLRALNTVVRLKCSSVIVTDTGILPKYCDSLSVYATKLTVQSLAAFNSVAAILHFYRGVRVLSLEFDNFCPDPIVAGSEEGVTVVMDQLVELRVSNRKGCQEIDQVFNFKARNVKEMHLSNLNITSKLHAYIVNFLQEPCTESEGGNFTKISIVNYTKCDTCDIGWMECNTIMEKYFKL